MFIQIWASMVIDFSRMTRWIPTFLEGVGVTIVLSLVTVTIGSILGLFITLLRRSHLLPVSALAKFYILFIRGTPLLVQLYVWLYALPLIGIVIPPLPVSSPVFGTREFSTAVIALGINSSAYVAEILRGGLDAIDKGQTEAARSLGLSSRQNMQYVVIPQAIRIILPGLGNEFIQMIKESSIVSTVGIFDVMYTSNIVKAGTYLVFEPLVIISLIYLILTSVLTFLQRQLERKLNVDLKSN
jgi:His/Glu/Gln/Arg/opine family amino acid ABC transporter permease subunit